MVKEIIKKAKLTKYQKSNPNTLGYFQKLKLYLSYGKPVERQASLMMN